jgi:hypothetical protein
LAFSYFSVTYYRLHYAYQNKLYAPVFIFVNYPEWLCWFYVRKIIKDPLTANLCETDIAAFFIWMFHSHVIYTFFIYSSDCISLYFPSSNCYSLWWNRNILWSFLPSSLTLCKFHKLSTKHLYHMDTLLELKVTIMSL